MIRAVFTHDRLTLFGHAGFAPRGQDIVCAAASALVYALIGALEEQDNIREVVVRPGHVSVAAKAGGRAEFDLIRCGLGQLAARYPACVRIERGEENGGNR